MKKWILFLVLCFLYGCGNTDFPTKTYEVKKPFTITLMNKGELNDFYHKLYPDRQGIEINGFTLPDSRKIYVMYDTYTSNGLPAMETLGHEISHFPELFGNYHEQKSIME